MKGFTTSTGYMGWVEDRYILFASEYDYRVYGRVKGMQITAEMPSGIRLLKLVLEKSRRITYTI